MGGGDPMVADVWFRQVEKVLEAIEITSDVVKIRLATFHPEGYPRYGGIGSRPQRIWR